MLGLNFPKIKIVFLFSLVLLFSCSKEMESSTPNLVYDPTPYQLPVGSLPTVSIAADNPLTIEGIRLGRMLFYERKLSGDNTQSCASCHNQRTAFSDTSKFSTGIRGKLGKRQAMAIFNMAWNRNEFFWDGRAHLLRDQSLMPIQDSLEMDASLPEVINKLLADPKYPNHFYMAFGSSEITAYKMSLALEQFMNSIVSINSKYDAYLKNEIQLDSSEERGRYLFFTDFNPAFPNSSGADCAHCHSGTNFENDKYSNNGLDTDAEMKDIGREAATNNSNDRGKFKVPSLRNIALTPPYMHDGRFKTLEEVVEHYNSGLKNSTTLEPALRYPLNNGGLQLSAEDKIHLVKFLKTLTDQSIINDPNYSNPFH